MKVHAIAIQNTTQEDTIMKAITASLLTALLIITASTMYAAESFNATYTTTDGKEYEVSITNSPEFTKTVKNQFKAQPEEIASIQLLGEAKPIMQSNGQLYFKQQAQVQLRNERTYKVTLKNFSQWMNEVASPKLTAKNQTLSKVDFNHSMDAKTLSAR